MIDAGDLRKGTTVEVDGVLYQVLDFQHIKIGRGSAQVRMKLKDIRAGHITERVVQAGTKFSRARVERQPAQYLYADGDLHHFMNTETYDQIALNTEQLGDALPYLSENATCQLLTHGSEAIGIELPAAVELKVAQTDPWVRGDTAQGGTKPARLETGMTVQVPLFINTGDRVKVDTRSGDYLGKA
ncbi:MAG: elongation factor P [Dehalococcoidia bacterium]|nr:MAG: elongation factor P [Dehalococcoidia bacterium]